MKAELVKNVNSWGNSAGILLPKEWLGQQVKITLIDRTLEIKKEIFVILEDYLDDVIGIYIVGSYARGEEEEDSDIDILVITNKLEKEIFSGKYNISLSPFEKLKKTILVQPELVLPRIREAKTILNSEILKEFETKLSTKSFKRFYDETRDMINVSENFIRIDEEKGEKLSSHSVVYSLLLRMRGLYFIKTLLENKKYKKKEFEKWVLNKLNRDEFDFAYRIYRMEKEDKSTKEIKISIDVGKKLIDFLKKEIEYLK